MKRLLMAVGLLWLGFSAPVSAQSQPTVFIGNVIAENVTPECFPPNQPDMFGDTDRIFNAVFIPGELNTASGWKTSFSVNAPFFSFVANVPVVPVSNPDGKLQLNAVYDGLYLDPLGNWPRRRGRVLQLVMNPATYDATTKLITLSVRFNNVLAIAGCSVTFRGVLAYGK